VEHADERGIEVVQAMTLEPAGVITSPIGGLTTAFPGIPIPK